MLSKLRKHVRHNAKVSLLDGKDTLESTLLKIDSIASDENKLSPSEKAKEIKPLYEGLLEGLIDTRDEIVQEVVALRCNHIAMNLTSIEKNPVVAETLEFQEIIEYWFHEFKNQYIEYKDVSLEMQGLRKKVNAKMAIDFVSEHKVAVVSLAFENALIKAMRYAQSQDDGFTHLKFKKETIIPMKKEYLDQNKGVNHLSERLDKVIEKYLGPRKLSLSTLSIRQKSPRSSLGDSGSSLSSSSGFSSPRSGSDTPLSLTVPSFFLQSPPWNSPPIGLGTPRGSSTPSPRRGFFSKSSLPPEYDKIFRESPKWHLFENVCYAFRDDIKTKEAKDIVKIFEDLIEKFKIKYPKQTLDKDSKYQLVMDSENIGVTENFYRNFLLKTQNALKQRITEINKKKRSADPSICGAIYAQALKESAQMLNKLVDSIPPENVSPGMEFT